MRNWIFGVGLSAVMLAGSSGFADAHAVWVAQRTGELAVIYGHGVGDDPYDPAKVKSANAYTIDGKPAGIIIVQRERNAIIQPDKEAALVEIFFDNGFWTERADGTWENVGKSKIADAKSAGHYVNMP